MIRMRHAGQMFGISLLRHRDESKLIEDFFHKHHGDCHSPSFADAQQTLSAL